jgi:hypothetical protein
MAEIVACPGWLFAVGRGHPRSFATRSFGNSICLAVTNAGTVLGSLSGRIYGGRIERATARGAP